MFILIFIGCKKESANHQIIPIPNGDFEQWDNIPYLAIWQTNSCPYCVPPYEPYIVKKVTDAEHGQYAAKFVYNNFFSSYAINRFAISSHPTSLIGYIKSNIATGDTAFIYIGLFSGNNKVDNGIFYETSSSPSYRQINIPITQTATVADSAAIKIVGGHMHNTELFVDNMVFIKSE